MCGQHKTVETKVSLEERVKSFTEQSLMVAISPKGKVIFCRCAALVLVIVRC